MPAIVFPDHEQWNNEKSQRNALAHKPVAKAAVSFLCSPVSHLD